MPAPVQGAAAPAFPSVPATLSPNAMTVERDRPDPAATVNGKAPASPSTPAIAAPPGQVPGRAASPALTLAPQMPAGEPGPPGVTEDDLAALRAAPEPGTVTRAAQSAPAPDMPPPATGRAAAQQVASAVRGGVERGFDITLSPAELGNVRITLTPADGGLSVSILADRPETLDLLRRHVADLAQEFRDIGYEDAEFSFGSEGQGAPRDGAAPGGARGAAAEDMPDGAASPQPADSAAAPDNGRMDIRI